MKNILILIILILALGACAHRPRYSPEQIYKMRARHVEASYEGTFDACLEVLHKNSFQIESTDRTSGVINASSTSSSGGFLSLLTILNEGYDPDPYEVVHINIFIKKSNSDSSFVSVLLKKDQYGRNSKKSAVSREASGTISPLHTNAYNVFFNRLYDNLYKKECINKGLTYTPIIRDPHFTEHKIVCGKKAYVGKVIKSSRKHLYVQNNRTIYKIDKVIISDIFDWEDKAVKDEVLNKNINNRVDFSRYSIEYIK